MTHQPSFARAEFSAKKKITRREKFLTRMEAVIPGAKLKRPHIVINRLVFFPVRENKKPLSRTRLARWRNYFCLIQSKCPNCLILGGKRCSTN